MIIEMPDDNSIVKWKNNDNEDWKSAEISDLIKSYEGRPQGEWIKAQGEWITDTTYKICFKCSECCCHFEYPFNFCPNCGVKMKGGEEE